MNSRGRIAILLTNDFTQDVRVYKEARYFIQRGFEVDMFCWQRDLGKCLPEFESRDGIKVRRIRAQASAGTGWHQIGAFCKYIKACKDYLKEETYDYVHCNDIDGAIAGYLACGKNERKVFDMHEVYESGGIIKRWAWRKLTIFLLKKSIAGLYENEFYLSNKYSAVRDKLYRLKNYPSREYLKAEVKTESDYLRVGYHGTVRNQICYFKALFEAVKDLDDVRVVINGGGTDYLALKRLEKQYNNVFVNGQYDGIRDSNWLYANTDILFCGYDGNSLNYNGDAEVVKFYEAIVTGTPMIMTKGTGMAQKVVNNGYGVVCDVASIEDIRRAVLGFKQNKAFWNECAENELRDANQYFWEKEILVLDNIYL